MDHWNVDDQVDTDFSIARLRAVRNGLVRVLRRQPVELLSYDDVRSRLFVRGQHDRALQTVPIAAIVGSEGRYADFDRGFLPLGSHIGDRWKSVDRAHYRGVELPPVDLYKLGDIYFVTDGNHRVSVARLRGQTEIDARVVELQIDIPLTPDLDLRDLMRTEERSDFYEWTNIRQLRPGCDIAVTELGGYLELIRHINCHRADLSRERGVEVSSADAVVTWYDTVYMPLVAEITASGVLRAFPRRTPADLYLWLIEHRRVLMRETGKNPTIDETVRTFVQRFRSFAARFRVDRELRAIARGEAVGPRSGAGSAWSRLHVWWRRRRS